MHVVTAEVPATPQDDCQRIIRREQCEVEPNCADRLRAAYGSIKSALEVEARANLNEK
jgi:hypothetical protein